MRNRKLTLLFYPVHFLRKRSDTKFKQTVPWYNLQSRTHTHCTEPKTQMKCGSLHTHTDESPNRGRYCCWQPYWLLSSCGQTDLMRCINQHNTRTSPNHQHANCFLDIFEIQTQNQELEVLNRPYKMQEALSWNISKPETKSYKDSFIDWDSTSTQHFDPVCI